eukprot:3098088-Pyramimonas_sp.AAC.1
MWRGLWNRPRRRSCQSTELTSSLSQSASKARGGRSASGQREGRLVSGSRRRGGVVAGTARVERGLG